VIGFYDSILDGTISDEEFAGGPFLPPETFP
jgi:hypothetical protein